MAGEVHVSINEETDIVVARQQGRELAKQLGFSESELTVIATAISELTRNIVDYAGHGEVIIKVIGGESKHGVEIIAHDNGPGIPNVELAMQDGYSTGHGLGLGLPGVKRLMDEFEITSQVGKGTTVVVKKWSRR